MDASGAQSYAVAVVHGLGDIEIDVLDEGDRTAGEMLIVCHEDKGPEQDWSEAECRRFEQSSPVENDSSEQCENNEKKQRILRSREYHPSKGAARHNRKIELPR